MIKDILKNDGRHIGSAFVKVYPMTLRRITSHWQITLAALFVIFSSFYLDSAVRSIVTGLNGSIIDSMFSFGRWYGSGTPTLYVFLGLYLGGLIFKKYKLRAAGLLAGEAYIFSGLITLIFKSALGRWRPYMNKDAYEFYGWSLTNNDQFSYFSGHAAVSFALSTILASTTENIYLKSFYYSLAVITCISRIYHQQHWFSDVVTGAIVAYLISRVLVAIHNEPEGNI
jgi:membrane-associated phospholipid phosphatase